MNRIRLSIIIPAYNVSQTIERCLNSILASVKDTDVEIICIDDGSTDTTLEILQEYAVKFPAVHVFHKVNGGVGSARNMGLLHASGHYIAWVDADDYVTANWYDIISANLQKYRPDCLFFDYYYTCGEIEQARRISLPEDVSLQAYVYEQSLERELKNFLWNHVIRADLLKQAKFNEAYHMLEDYDVLTEVTSSFQRIIHAKHCLYYYVQNEHSLTHTASVNVLWQNIAIVKRRYDCYSKLGLHVSINDYVVQLTTYLYRGNSSADCCWIDRKRKIKQILRKYGKEIIIDSGIPKKVRIKVGCFIIGVDRVLKFLLKIKRG